MSRETQQFLMKQIDTDGEQNRSAFYPLDTAGHLALVDRMIDEGAFSHAQERLAEHFSFAYGSDFTTDPVDPCELGGEG